MTAKRFAPPKKSNKTTIDIAALEAEKRQAYQSGDKKRIEEVNEKIDWIYYGIK